MAKQSQLDLIIKLCGSEDASFKKLGESVTSFGGDVARLGTQISLIMAPVLKLGKSTLDLYTDYDDVLKAVQAVGSYTAEEMQRVDEAARQAGRDTRYTATNAGNAFLYLTQAGVDLNDTIALLPTVLNAAAAGNMELADATDLLISNLYSLGKSFDPTDATAYMDKVTTAADSTNTTLAELMAGVSKLGAAGQMFSSDTELLTFLGMMANLNAKGTTGGVNARNMIISLLAPTNKAAELMDALAISEEDMNEALEDLNLEDSAAMMQRLGLKTTDAAGKARPMIDILTDLNSALSDMTDDEKANALYTIFGKRTYPVVAGLLGMLDQYPDLFAEISGSMGSTQKKAETMESGIGGRLRMLKSAWEEVLIAIGDAADEKAIGWFESARDFLLSASEFIGNLDESAVNTILDVLGTLTVAGPALMIGGTAIKILGEGITLLGTNTGRIILAAAAVGFLANSIYNLQQQSIQKALDENFGSLNFDAEKMQAYMHALSSEFETGYKNLDSYKESIQGAEQSYISAVEGLSAGMLDSVLRNVELTESDKAALLTYATNMSTELRNALALQKLMVSDIIDLSFNGENEGDGQKNTAWRAFTDSVFGGLYEEAEKASKELRERLVSALEGNELSDAEREAIAASQARMSRIMAEITGYENRMQSYTQYAKATDLGWGTIAEHFDLVGAARESSDAATRDAFSQLEALVLMAQDDGIAISKELQDIYGIGATDYTGALAAIRAERDAQILDNRMQADEVNARIASHAYGEINAQDEKYLLDPFYNLVDQIIGGTMTVNEAQESAFDMLSGLDWDTKSSKTKALNAVTDAIDDYLGYDTLVSMMKRQLETDGKVNDDLFALYRDYLMAGLFTQSIETVDKEGPRSTNEYPGLDKILINGTQFSTAEDMRTIAEGVDGFMKGVQDTFGLHPAQMGIEYPDAYEGVSTFTQAVQSNLDANPVTVLVNYSNVKGGVTVGGGIGGTNGGSRASMNAAAEMLYYADGGRSDVPAVFGEAGAEWAIPEEHTQRTAQLLASAAKASGFTFAELIARTGGLSAMGSASTNFTFAPTIYAQDSRGVADAIERGRRDMEAWFEEKMRLEERMSFA